MAINWPDFLAVTQGAPHWPRVEQAAALFPHPGRALDLGCGAGRDTRYLLSKGWHVTAIDREDASMAALAQLPQDNLRAVQSAIEDFAFEPAAYDLISAQFSLPFIPPTHFAATFTRIKQSLKPGGIFTGQFFGVHDSWNSPEFNMSFATQQQAEELLDGLQIMELIEEEKEGKTALGEPHHWHAFHILARKPV
jgi:tellurite methyltransferase